MKTLAWHRDVLAQLTAAKTALPHALLVRGPRGIGKLVFARALAEALLCETPAVDGAACGGCSACGWFEAGSHPDYRQIEPLVDEEAGPEDSAKKTTIAVRQIRALAELVNVSSHRGGPKVIIIHPAEAMHVSAANALLKSLEEPPPRTHFVLVTHRPHQLLPTIRSRCRQLALTQPSVKVAADWLKEQGVAHADAALAHSGGAPLLALDLTRGGEWVARSAFLRELGSGRVNVISAADALRDVAIPSAISWLQKWSYDIARFQRIGEIRYNPDFGDAIARIARAARPLDVLRFHREMVKLQPVAQHPLNPRLALENLLLAYRDLFEQRVPV